MFRPLLGLGRHRAKRCGQLPPRDRPVGHVICFGNGVDEVREEKLLLEVFARCRREGTETPAEVILRYMCGREERRHMFDRLPEPWYLTSVSG